MLCHLPALVEATYRDHYPSSCVVVGVTKKFCHIFLGNHRGQLSDIWHRTSVWRTVSCNAFLNLRHVQFLFDATLNIVDIGKFAHKIISVTFFSGTTEASFLIFGTEHQYGELYRVTHFWICGMSTSCLTRLWIFKRKELGRRHMSSQEDLLTKSFCLSGWLVGWYYTPIGHHLYHIVIIEECFWHRHYFYNIFYFMICSRCFPYIHKVHLSNLSIWFALSVYV